MDRSRLIHLIHNPYQLVRTDTEDLEEISGKYPYFQVTQVLLALALFRDGNPMFAGQLKKAAACIPSRSKLRDLFAEPLFGQDEEEPPAPGQQQEEIQTTPLLFLTKEDIIEKFIREEPKISRPKGEFYNPNESAIRSSVDEEEIVSETLARLYEKQGDKSKAVKIYEKLSLLIPEKSRYFAAQIEKLKEK